MNGTFSLCQLTLEARKFTLGNAPGVGQQLRALTWEADIKEIGASGSGESYRGRLQIKKAGA